MINIPEEEIFNTGVIKDCTGKNGPYEKDKFEFVKAQEDIFK